MEQPPTVHLIEDRRTVISPWGSGNPKVGEMYTYSRLPGRVGGTCPGASVECGNICYAKRVVYNEPVWQLWTRNSLSDEVAPLPEPLRRAGGVVRLHVSGDFDSLHYLISWCKLVNQNQEVKFFGYTRSWRVPELVPWLIQLRGYENMQLFASVDASTELPPEGWRRAWIDGDSRLREDEGNPHVRAFTGPWHDMNRDLAYVCPQETGRKLNCLACNYCIRGRRGDVVFLKH